MRKAGKQDRRLGDSFVLVGLDRWICINRLAYSNLKSLMLCQQTSHTIQKSQSKGVPSCAILFSKCTQNRIALSTCEEDITEVF